HRVAHLLCFHSLAEGWAGWLATRKALQEIGHLMDETVLVANLQARYPPLAHIGMVAIGNVNRPPAAYVSFIAMVEIGQAVQVAQVPLTRGLLTVDLERVEGFVTASITGRLKRGQRAVFEARE